MATRRASVSRRSRLAGSTLPADSASRNGAVGRRLTRLSILLAAACASRLNSRTLRSVVTDTRASLPVAGCFPPVHSYRDVPFHQTICEKRCNSAALDQLKRVLRQLAMRRLWIRSIPRDRCASTAPGAGRPIVVVPPVLPQMRSCPTGRTSLTALGHPRSVVCRGREST